MEFALILPVLLLLTLGVVDVARLFTSWIALNSGVGQAALYATNVSKLDYWCMDPSTAPAGSIGCPTGTGAAPADEACGLIAGDPAGNWCADPDNIAYRLKVDASGLDPARITLVAPTCSTDLGATIDCADVTAANITIGASYTIDLITPVIGNLIGNHILMSADATAPIIPVGP